MHKFVRKYGAIISYLMIVGFAAWALNSASSDRSRDRQNELIQACLRGNIIRGQILLGSRERQDDPQLVRSRDRTLPLVNCEPTVLKFHNRQVVPLSEENTQKYLDILLDGHIPFVTPEGEVFPSL